MEGTFLNVMAEFDERTQRTLRALYEGLARQGFVGRQSKALPYHLTLGVYPPAMEATLLQRLDALAASSRSLPVRLGGLGLFRLDVLFAVPALSQELLDLRKPFADSTDGRDWSPHATILKDRPEVVARAVPLAAERFAGLSGRLVAVSLWQFRPTRFVARVELPDSPGTAE